MTGPNRTQNMLSRLSVMDRMASAICHGPASLLDVKLSNGQYLIQGKNVTSFTDSEEGDMKMLKVMPFLLETELRKRGDLPRV